MGHSTTELTQDIDATRQSLSREIDELTDKVSPSRIVQRQKDAARSKLGSFRDQVMGTAADTTRAVSNTASAAAESVQGTADDAVRTAQGNPLAVGLVAFGVGLVAASLIPGTKQEARLAHAAVETAKEQGAPILHDGAEHLKDTATKAAQDLQSSAQDAAEHVKDEATAAAGSLKDDAQNAAESVKQTAEHEGKHEGVSSY